MRVLEGQPDMLATHRDGRAAYCRNGDRYEHVFGPGTTLDDVLLIQERTVTGDWHICFDARVYTNGAVAPSGERASGS